MSGEHTITIQVELPGDLVSEAERDALGTELRIVWAVEQVRQKRCSIGKAAKLAGLPRAAFMRVLGEHGVPVIDYPLDELRSELQAHR